MEKKKTPATPATPARKPARDLTTRKLTKKELTAVSGGRMPPTPGCCTQGCC
ncbi:MAG: hypothetical protein H7138_27935 [Myxococcales bacterium]|nr:hypothetical protein [Myxococcales bacterium]